MAVHPLGIHPAFIAATVLTTAGCLEVLRSDANPSEVSADSAEETDGSSDTTCALDSDCEGLIAVNGCQRADCQNGICVAVADNEGGVCVSSESRCITGTCATGQCANLTATDCSALDSLCGAGECQESSGECVTIHRPSGTDCAQKVCQSARCDGSGACIDDGPPVGEPCTTGTPCLIDGRCTAAGICDESWDAANCPCVSDGDCDDGLTCTVGSCEDGVCSFVPYDTACAINGACYFKGEPSNVDPCVLCTPAISQSEWSPRSCGDANPCTVDSCDPQLGCTFDEASANGSACSDGPGCATEALGVCSMGVCGGCELECSLSSQCAEAPSAPAKNACQTYKCDEGKCLVVADPTVDGQACDTGDPCSANGACLDGSCVGTPVVCDPQPCSVGTCQPLTDGGFECSYALQDAGTPCDTGDACIIDAQCDGLGVCQGQALDCSSFDFGPCLIGVCSDGTCGSVPAQDGVACDIEGACTENDTCKDGACTAGQAICACSDNVDCDDGLACTFDICDSGTCTFQVQQDTCLIGGACYAQGAVNPANPCVECGAAPNSWSPITCSDGNPCTDDTCDPSQGGCIFTVDTSNACNDGDPCSADDQCDASGSCVGICECDDETPCSGTPPPCSKWSCDNNTCVAIADGTLNGTECDDGQFCTVSDSCQQGGCFGTPRDCSSADVGLCIVGQCDEPAATCVGVNAQVSTPCDDSDPCTQADSCDGSGACLGQPRDCSDADDLPCVVGACVGGNCIGEPQSGQSCDDGESCTLDDVCDSSGACVGTWDTATAACGCNADSDCAGLATDCKDAFCEQSTHQCYTQPKSLNTACDDGLACTLLDRCDGQGGCSGTLYSCDDGLSCTEDTCDGTGQCSNTPFADFCVIDETCYADGTSQPNVACQGCVAEVAPTQWSPLEGNTCDDGDPCTDSDLCDASGNCAGGSYTCFDDELPCTSAVCGPGDGECLQLLNPGFCLIGNVCVAQGSTDPSNSCQACKPSSSTEQWTPIGGDCDDGDPCTYDDTCSAATCNGISAPCSDGLGCTEDLCDGLGGCEHPILAQRCLIAGACYTQDSVNPVNECQVCLAAQSNTGWSGVALGTACDDGLPCTSGEQCDGAGQCTGGDSTCVPDSCEQATCNAVTGECETSLKPGHCKIDDVCFVDGDLRPGESCQACLASQSTSAWTPVPAKPCDDGEPCTYDDTCQMGQCAGTNYSCDSGSSCQISACDGEGGCDTSVAPGQCLIANACYSEGTPRPGNSCATCQPDVSALSWTPLAPGTACDGPECTVNACSNGVCESTYAADSGQCYISGQCHEDGTANPVNPCSACDLANPLTWSVLPDQTPCGAVAACSGEVCISGTCKYQNAPEFSACDDADGDTFGDWCVFGTCHGFTRHLAPASDVPGVSERYMRAGGILSDGSELTYATYESPSQIGSGSLKTDTFLTAAEPESVGVTVGSATTLDGSRRATRGRFVGRETALFRTSKGQTWQEWTNFSGSSPVRDVISGGAVTPLSGGTVMSHVFVATDYDLTLCLSDGFVTCATDPMTLIGTSAGFVILDNEAFFFDTSAGSLRAFTVSDGFGGSEFEPVTAAWVLKATTATSGRIARHVEPLFGGRFLVVGDAGLVAVGTRSQVLNGADAGQLITVPGFSAEQAATNFGAATVYQERAFAVGHATLSSATTTTRTIWFAHAPLWGVENNASWRFHALWSLPVGNGSPVDFLDDTVGNAVKGNSNGLHVFGGLRETSSSQGRRAHWVFEP